MRRTTTLLATVLLAACDKTSAPPAPTPTPAVEAVPRQADDGPADLTARAPDRGKVRGGEPMRRKVEWPAPELRNTAAYDGLDAASRTSVDTAPVPILIPADTFPLDERRVMHGPEWAAFWGHKDAITVSLHASRMARVLPGVEPKPGTHTLRKREGFITRNEGIWSASWIEYGVAYSLELECAPPDAPACADESTLVAIAEGLTYVGGRGEQVTP